jgi:hypothetical protein
MVAGIESGLRLYAEMYKFDGWGDDVPEFVIGGWSAERARPEIYSIAISDRVGPWVRMDVANNVVPEAYRLKMTNSSIIASPSFHGPVADAGEFLGLRSETSVEATIADLRIAIEVQRQFQANDGVHYIGAFGEVMIVRRGSIEQRLLCRWPDDKIGEKITPAPIDWPALRARAAEIEWGPVHRPAAGPMAGPSSGLNRLQRRALARDRR